MLTAQTFELASLCYRRGKPRGMVFAERTKKWLSAQTATLLVSASDQGGDCQTLDEESIPWQYT
jgi:hypothetical protein